MRPTGAHFCLLLHGVEVGNSIANGNWLLLKQGLNKFHQQLRVARLCHALYAMPLSKAGFSSFCFALFFSGELSVSHELLLKSVYILMRFATSRTVATPRLIWANTNAPTSLTVFSSHWREFSKISSQALVSPTLLSGCFWGCMIVLFAAEPAFL